MSGTGARPSLQNWWDRRKNRFGGFDSRTLPFSSLRSGAESGLKRGFWWVRRAVGGPNLVQEIGANNAATPAPPATAQTRSVRHSLFYLSVNIGGAFGPLLGSAVKRLFGWPSVFVLASSLMALSVATTLWFRESERKEERLAPTGNAPSPMAELKAALPYLTVFIIYLSVYAQSSGALLLFARDHVQRSLLGNTIAVEIIAAFPSVFVLIATPLVSALIHRLRKQRREPATGGKIIAGLLTTVAAFVVLSAVSRQVSADHKVAFIWFGLSLALISTGELLVVPMMQSLLGQLAPRSAFTTAFLFVAMSIGYTLGGWVGTLYERLSGVVFFGVCAGLAIVAAAGMMVVTRRQGSAGQITAY